MARTQTDNSARDLFVNFNQDSTSLSVGSHHGYKLFSLNSVDKLEQIYDNEGALQDVSIVERLFSTSLVAVVSLDSPRKLKVYHFKKGTEICNYSFSNTILAIKLNRVRLVVVLEESLYIHDTRDMKVIHTIRDTPSNVKGICTLSAGSENALLAYPGSPHTGEVQIFDATNLKAVTMIHAHNSSLAALAFNKDASLLSTASDKGTVIRVFSIPDGRKAFEFRRGMKRCVSINTLAFSSNSIFLASSSNTETVHIFKLENMTSRSCLDSPVGGLDYQSNCTKSESSWTSYFSKMITTSSSYLPMQVSDILNQDRAFATVKLPTACRHNICTLTVIQKLLRVVVVSTDGYMYIYNLDVDEGGECTLIRQHRLAAESSMIARLSPTPIAIPISTYADATRGKQGLQAISRSKDRSGSTGSSASSSSDSTFSNVSKSDSPTLKYSHSPKGRLKGIIDEHELAEGLPLNDESEFPPMTMYCE